jgi:hypothetical protein
MLLIIIDFVALVIVFFAYKQKKDEQLHVVCHLSFYAFPKQH